MPNPLYDNLVARHRGKDSPFLFLPGGGTVTHGAFVNRASQLAHALCRQGLSPGDRVAVQVAKTADALALYAACLQAGLVLLPLNTAYTEAEVSYFVENSGARLVIGGGGGDLAAAAARLGAGHVTLASEGGTLAALADAAPHDFPTVARAESDLAAILYTSGTTGRPKGAMLTQDNLLSNARVLAALWQFSAADVLLHALPIFHTHGLFVACNTVLLTGGAMIFLPRFDSEAILAALPRATVLMGVPTYYSRLLAEPRLTRELVRHMRLFVSGSAPLLEETHRAFAARTGHTILERYGLTETGMNASNPYDGERRAGTVGQPLAGVEIRITDQASGEILPDGEIGRIEVRGANVTPGYWQMSDKTREAFRDDGFFITGDLGRFDGGYLEIVGREKDLIIAGGFNIYPKEIETLLDAEEGVLESAVVGVPDADLGEKVVGFVVLRPGATANAQALLAALGRRLARFKLPRELHFIDALPRNTMGKVQKNILAERHARSATGSPRANGT
jgi:malonyl-CoA/methylmalonyl-CoA synthetase